MKRGTLKIFTTLLVIFLFFTTIQNVSASTTNNQLTLNGEAKGALDNDVSKQSYSITLPNDGNLKLFVYPDNSLSVEVDLYDTDAVNLVERTWSNVSSSGNASLNEPLKAGTYYVNVSVVGGSGNYDIKNTFTPETYLNDQEPNDDTQNASLLNNGELKQGRLGFYGDGTTDSADYYKVKTSGGKLNIIVSPYNSLSVEVDLYDTDAANLIERTWSNVSSSGNASLSQTVESGTYFIKVSVVGGSGGYSIKAGSSSVKNFLEMTAILLQ